MSGRVALLAGATGQVGGACLRLLSASPLYEIVHVVARDAPGPLHSKVEWRQIDFADMSRFDPPAVDDVYCVLGAKLFPRPARDAVELIEYRYPLEIARLSKHAGARRFLTVTSVEADPRSRLHYLRTKGRLERDLQRIGFESLHLFRPSFLARPSRGASLLNTLLAGRLRRFRVVGAEEVARAMVDAAAGSEAGCRLHHFG